MIPRRHSVSALTSFADGKALATELDCPHFEVSSVTKHNVDEAMQEMVREVRRYNRALPALADQSAVPTSRVANRDRKTEDARHGRRCCLIM